MNTKREAEKYIRILLKIRIKTHDDCGDDSLLGEAKRIGILWRVVQREVNVGRTTHSTMYYELSISLKIGVNDQERERKISEAVGAINKFAASLYKRHKGWDSLESAPQIELVEPVATSPIAESIVR